MELKIIILALAIVPWLLLWIAVLFDWEVFYTDEEKEEIKEAIRQKVALMVTDKLKDFILLRK